MQLVLLNRHPLRIEAFLELAASANRWPALALVGGGAGIVIGDQAAELWVLS
ncbi:MAG: hypothetical protein ABR498_05480 [Candidatus Dormibacteria bacterium]